MYKFEACEEMISKFEDLREEIIGTIEDIVLDEEQVDLDVLHMRVREDLNEYSGYIIVEENMKRIINTSKGVKVLMTLNYPTTDYDSENVDEDLYTLSMDELYALLRGLS
jgi:hypothetical protein